MCNSNSKPTYPQAIVIINGILTLSDRLRSGEQSHDEPFQFNGYTGPHAIVRHTDKYRSAKDIIVNATVESLARQGFIRKDKNGCKGETFELTVKALDFFLLKYVQLATRFFECEAGIMEVVLHHAEAVRFFLTKWDRVAVKGSISPSVMFNEAENWTFDLREMFVLPNPFDLLKPDPNIQWPNKIPGLEVAVWYRNNLIRDQFKIIHLLRYYGEPIVIFVQEGENVSYYNEFVLNQDSFLMVAFEILRMTFDRGKRLGVHERIGNIPAFPRNAARVYAGEEYFYSWNDIDAMRRECKDD